MSGTCQKATSRADIRATLEKLDLPALGLAVLKEAAFSQPLRRVKSGRSNVTYRMVSRKMGCTIQCESHIEHAVARDLEFGPTKYFWDQALKLQVKYSEVEGRNRSLDTIMDYVAIEDGKVLLTDCKSTTDLQRISERCPDRYVRNENGAWTSPAGERAAARLGFEYRVRSDSDVNVFRQRNYEYLADYLNHTPDEDMEKRIDSVIECLDAERIMRLSALHEAVNDRDAVHWAIAHSYIFVDIDIYLVERPGSAEVCADRSLATAVRGLRFAPEGLELSSVNLESGTTVIWNGVPHEVQCAGPDGYSLLGPNDQPCMLSREVAAEYVRRGAIKSTNVPAASTEIAINTLKHATEKMEETARYRYKVLELDANGIDHSHNERTVRRWRDAYEIARRQCGFGMLGLYPKSRSSGRTNSRLMDLQETLCAEVIEQDYLTPNCKTMMAAYTLLVEKCDENNVPQIDYSTFTRRIGAIDARVKAQRREGRGPAYQLGPRWHGEIGDPAKRIPRQGSRAWEAAEMDHTVLDEELKSEYGAFSIGKPYVSLLADRYSAKPLAHVLSYDPPDAATAMCLLRECVRRWGRLPGTVVVDRGKEFDSERVEKSIARLGVHKLQRPPHEPRHGAKIERAFRTIHTSLAYNTAGNTQNSKPGDRSRPRHEPSDHVRWTPREFNDLLEEFLYTVFPDQPNSGTKESAQERYDRSIAEQGARNHVYIPYDRTLYVLTLPDVPGGNRKVRKGHVKVLNATYTAPELRDLSQDGENLRIRYDPENRAQAYVFVRGEWVRLYVVDSEVLDLLEHQVPFLHLELAARARHAGRRYRHVPATCRRLHKAIREHERKQFEKGGMEMKPDLLFPTPDMQPDDPSKRITHPAARPSFPALPGIEDDLPEDLI